MVKKKASMGILSTRQIQNKYPGAGLASEIAVVPDDTLWLPSRCLPLNYALGGGIPYGKTLEIYGEESSGKTLAALDFGAVAHSLGGEVMINDAEQAFTAAWATNNGLDLSRIHLFNETAVERVSDWVMDTAISIRSRLTNNEPIVFIQDSIAALDCLSNINSTQTDSKAEMGNRAKAIYKMVRIRNQMLSELGIISIYINQLRKKVGVTKWEDPDTTPGGAAMKFFASQRLGIYAGKQVKESVNGFEDRVGTETSIRVKKNKVAPPRPTFKAKIYFNMEYSKPLGFDRYLGLGELFLKIGTVQRRPGSTMITFEGESISRSERSLDAKLAADPKLRKKLISASSINTVSKTRVKIDGTGKNLYPVKTRKFISQLTPPEDE